MAELQGRILITGGAGFLGRAIVQRSMDEQWPCEFIVYSRDEQKQAAMQKKFGKQKFLQYVVGDINDTRLLALVMKGVDLVIHAAAIKYIPEAEMNVNTCITVNVDGSRSVLEAAHNAEAPRVVGVSTDKAVSPLNVYGASKMLMERMFQEEDRYCVLADEGRRVFTVRYGNVVGSTGSVIPFLKKCASETGKMPITDVHMTRFWISAWDAVDLVVHAAVEDLPVGCTVIPRPQSMSMQDLAHAIDPLAEIETIGLRPGEKMDESLLSEAESVRAQAGRDGYIYLLTPDVRLTTPAFGELSSADADNIPDDVMAEMIEIGGSI